MRHFEAWYPQLGSRLNAIMLRNCKEQLEYYRSDSAPYNSCVSCQAEAVETCLENAPEWRKESMAVGVGCRTEAVETRILKVEYGCCQRPAGPASNNSQSRRFKHCRNWFISATSTISSFSARGRCPSSFTNSDVRLPGPITSGLHEF